jgi:hypothetical protein
MGAYIDPRNERKEAFLSREGVRLEVAPKWEEVPRGFFAVCLIDNGGFLAAGIAFDEHELRGFSRIENRPTIWFQVSIDKMWDVSTLHNYLPFLEPEAKK